MKQLQTYTRSVQYLNKIFRIINTELFGGELETPTITIQSTARAYGHVTVSKVWVTEKGDASHELNVSADYLNRPIENVVATLTHEAVHLYCMAHSIQDTSNRGVYHNIRFKTEAEARGLIIEKHPVYGYTITTPGDRVLQLCLDYDLTEILINRDTGCGCTGTGTGKAADDNPTPTPPTTPKTSSTIKWTCPVCKAKCRTTKIINIVCGDCGVQFVKVE